jgi:inosose dehydratase
VSGKDAMNYTTSDTPDVALPLRLATAPVNWNNNDIPGWRPKVPFPEILDRVIEAGYSASEYDDSFGRDPSWLNSEAFARDITWCGCYQWVDFLDSDGLDERITDLVPKFQLLNDIDCSHLIVADSLRPHRVALAGQVRDDGSQSLHEDEIRRLADGVHHLAETAEGFGLAVHYHNHVGSWIEAPHELDMLLQHLDQSRVDLCFDTGHYAYGGGEAAPFIREHLDAIGYLHLKDVDTEMVSNARERKLTFIEALKEYVFSPLGDGSADIPAILDTLLEGRFDGWVVVEQDTCQGDSTQTAKENLQFIESWFTNNNGRTMA